MNLNFGVSAKVNNDQNSSENSEQLPVQAQLKIAMKTDMPSSLGRYSKCTIAKPEKVDFYSQCFPQEGKYVNIEGPEFV